MATLNQYASRIANILGRQDDHAMRERVKDGFKAIFATRIRQSISKNGIDELFMLTCEIPIELDTKIIVSGFHVFRNKLTVRVPVPVRFQNDAIFTSVTTDGDPSLPFSSRTLIELKLSAKHALSGSVRAYSFTDGILRLFVPKVYGKFVNTSSSYKIAYATTIWENPEEVITMANSTFDANDVELPFPSDMLESIVFELLKTEFNYMPPEVEVKS